MKKHKFESIFANIKIRPVVSEEKDKYLSLASINKLRKFLPEINTEENIDLLPIAFDACVVNRVNKNGDVMNGETAAKVAKNFINKPINIEHNRNQVIGCIVSANFSKFGTNESLAEVDVKEMKAPFNITLGGVIWKVVNRDLAEQIEESNDPTSENYMSISASWELGFNDYNLVVLEDGEKNIENGAFISDEKEIEKFSGKLRSNGGSGKIDNNKYIYRQVLGNVVPLGIGLTLNPAADVQGVAIKSNEGPAEIKFKEEEKNNTDASLDENIQENNISQEENLNVKKERIYMKITKIEDITDNLLKEVTATAVVDFIADEIKKASDKFTAEKVEKESELKAANEKAAALATEQEAVKKQLEELNQKLAALEAEKAAKIQEETFNMRMASFDEEYDLEDEDRKVIAKTIKDLDEKAFEEHKEVLAVLMKEKKKSYKKAMNEKMQKAKAEEVKVEETKASEAPAPVATTQEVVEQAVDNGSKASVEIPNSAPVAEPTIREKYAKAFDLSGFEIRK